MSSGVTGPPACVAAQVDHSDWGGGYGVHGARPAALHVGAPPRVRAQCGRVGPLRRHCGRVHARCEGMQRPPSLTVTLSARSCPPPLRAAVAPDAPGTPWLVHRSPYTLEVAWSLGHDHGEPPQEHEVAWRVTEAGHGMVEDCSDATVAAEPAQGSTPGPWRLERVLAPATACTLSSLLPATGVECRVRSCNRIGWSPFGPASDTFRCDGAAAAIAPACPPPLSRRCAQTRPRWRMCVPPVPRCGGCSPSWRRGTPWRPSSWSAWRWAGLQWMQTSGRPVQRGATAALGLTAGRSRPSPHRTCPKRQCSTARRGARRAPSWAQRHAAQG